MFLHHEHFEVYYCINDQIKLQIFREGGKKNVSSENRSICHFSMPRNNAKRLKESLTGTSRMVFSLYTGVTWPVVTISFYVYVII